MIHLLATFTLGTVYAVVPLRTLVSTVVGADFATKFDIYTGAVILPASGTLGGAFQPDRRPDEVGCKKRPGGYGKCSHFIAVKLRLESAHKRQYGNEDNWPEQISHGFLAGARSIPPPIIL